MSRLPLLFGLIFTLVGALPLACGGNDDESDAGTGGAAGGCAHDSDCAEGVCTEDGVCVGCRGDGDCGRAQRCDSSVLSCVFRDGWADECTGHGDCPASMICLQGMCVPSDPEHFCGGLGQCGEGLRCNHALGVCEEDLGCFSDTDCLEDEVCNTGTGVCELRCTPETEIEICQVRETCVDGRCMACRDDGDCGPGLVCNQAAGRCAGPLTCFSDRDCSAGQVCNRGTATCTEPPPRCHSNGDCLPDERCNLGDGRCVLKACLPDRDEPNDDQASATTIGPGLREGLTLCGTEDDWYRIPLERNDRVLISIETNVLASTGLDAQLRDEAGREVARGSLVLDATVAVSGDYFLRLRTFDAQASYALNVIVARGQACDDDEYEENDEIGLAAPLPTGRHESLVACPADPDWYELHVPAGSGVQVEMSHDPLSGDLDLLLFDSDGQTLLDASRTTEPVERVEAAGVSGGRAWLLVLSDDDRTRNFYDLSIVTQ